jgi:hypothetical protein
MVYVTTTSVIMTLQKELVHQWVDCDLEGVEFLQHPHRHMFHIEAEVVVGKNDDSREIEIILCKRAIEKYIDDTYPDGNMKNTSCEVLAHNIGMFLHETYNSNWIRVKVLEDGENGSNCTLEFS